MRYVVTLWLAWFMGRLWLDLSPSGAALYAVGWVAVVWLVTYIDRYEKERRSAHRR